MTGAFPTNGVTLAELAPIIRAEYQLPDKTYRKYPLGQDVGRFRALLLTIAAALIITAPAGAALQLSGDVRPRHTAWTAAAAQHVPLPNEQLWIVSGWDPEFIPEAKEILLPQPGKGGWTYADEHYLLLHELGHAFDYQYLTPSSRAAFKQAIGSPCSWWSTRCWSPRFAPRKVSVPPGEDFAELYAACALGLTRLDADIAGYPSYGWDPPAGKDDLSLCTLIRRG